MKNLNLIKIWWLKKVSSIYLFSTKLLFEIVDRFKKLPLTLNLLNILKANRSLVLNALNKTNSLINNAKVKIYPFLNKSPFLQKTIQSLSSVISKWSYTLNKIPAVRFLSSFFQKKHVVIFCSALFISFLIFYFMSLLISSGHNLKNQKSQNISINFLLNASNEELELRSRRQPKKPKEEEPPPQSPKLRIQQTEIQKPELLSQLPKLELPDDGQGASVSTNDGGNRDVTPIFRVNPIYPRRAALQNIEGFVILKFDITEIGQTDNISILQASPPQIFNSSAMQALQKWKYKPRTINGKPTRQNNLKVQLSFTLTKD